MKRGDDERIRAGVIGWPIDHSLSPAMMSHWISQTGLSAAYDPIAISPDDAETEIRKLAESGLSGLNVTLPHKLLALEMADEVSSAAKTISAANLLTFKDGSIKADNTDARGFILGLQDDGIEPSQGPALVLGAGGAARAVIHGLLESGNPEIFVTNRTRSRAEEIRDHVDGAVRIVDWTDRSEALSDSCLIINTTSMGLKGENDLVLDWTRASRQAAAVDIVYSPLMTGFLSDAAAKGLQTQNGLAMLVGQARPSFQALFGRTAPDEPDMRDILSARLEMLA